MVSIFLELFFITVFKNTENNVLIFFEICFCCSNLMFFEFFVFFKTKEKKEQNVFFVCSSFSFSLEQKIVFKNLTKQVLSYSLIVNIIF